MNKKKKFKNNIVLFLFGMVSPIYFLMLNGTQFIFFALIAVIIFTLLRSQNMRIYVMKDKLYACIVANLILSSVSGVIFNNNPSQWKWQAIVFLIYDLLIYVFYIMSANFSKRDIKAFFQGFKICAVIQIIYGYIQYFSYLLFKLDLNQTLFGKILNLDHPLSHYNYGRLVPSGFSWHAGTFAPLLVITYCMAKSSFVLKILIIGIAALTQSSTCIIGVMCCAMLNLFVNLKKIHIKWKKRTIMFTLAVFTIGIIIIFKTGIIHILVNEVKRLFIRVLTKSNASVDMSSYFHKRYYLGLPDIVQNSNLMQLIWGYGEGCSGYPFVKVFNQYASTSPWVVESEIINRLLNRGIIGFVFIYIWLVRIAKNGWKISKQYAICFIALFFESITYNIGFFWVLIVEIMMQLAVKKGMNIWSSENE